MRLYINIFDHLLNLSKLLLKREYLRHQFIEFSENHTNNMFLLGKALTRVRAELLNEERLFLSNRKPIICPACGERRVVSILYGEPTKKMICKEEEGHLILGGRSFSENSPQWGCTNCGLKLHKSHQP